MPDTEPEPAPEIQLRPYRKLLFIAELERLLGAPSGFDLGNDFDPLRVRLDQGVSLVERRAAEGAARASSRCHALRLSVMASCVVGIGALFAALGAPRYQLPAYAIAIVELILVLTLTRRAREHAVDAVELERLRDRYRPMLEDARDAADLRALADRMRSEMREAWEAPEEGAA
jgi:hypothetical protein